MIICEAEFNQPDPKTPKYSMTEVDFYSHIPPTAPLGTPFNMRNHRLSLRKNLETGQFEVYRCFMQRSLTSQKVQMEDEAGRPILARLTLITNRPVQQKVMVVAFDSKDLREAVRFASGEARRFWSGLHKEEDDKVCEHKPPNLHSRCEIWKETSIDKKMEAHSYLRRKKRTVNLSRYEPLCRQLIVAHLKARMSEITSWNEFGESRDAGFIDEDVSHHVLLKAMAYGKLRGWLKAEWHGIGMTPFAGSAQRIRCYKIMEHDACMQWIPNGLLHGKEKTK